MSGTRSTTGLSRFQQVLVLVIWLGSFFVLAFVLAPRFPDNPAATIVTIATFLPSAVITWALYRFAAQPQTQISTLEGLRGQFKVYDFVWPLLLVPAGMLVVIGFGVLGESRLARIPLAWAIALVAALLVIGGPLVMIARRVHAFRVDDDGQAWVRHWNRYQALHVSTFAQVQAHTLRSRYGGVSLTRLVFSGGDSGLRRVSLPISYVVSQRYHTLVYATVVSAFFLDQCEKAGFTVQLVGNKPDRGWRAICATCP